MIKDLRPRWEKKAAIAVDGIERMTFSFYKYVRIEDPKKLQEELLENADNYSEWLKICLDQLINYQRNHQRSA